VIRVNANKAIFADISSDSLIFRISAEVEIE